MMSQKRFLPAAVENPGRSRDVSLGETALEAERIAFHEIPESQRRITLGGVTHQIIFEEVEESLAVHGRKRGNGTPFRPGGTAH